MPVTPGVINIHIRPHYRAVTIQDLLDEATHGAPAGEHVRLNVSKMRPPAFIHHWCNQELFWQVVAPDHATKEQWEAAINGKDIA